LRELQRLDIGIIGETGGKFTAESDIDKVPQFSARRALEVLGYHDDETLDGYAIPTIEEIEDAMRNRCPLLATIGADTPGTGKVGGRHRTTEAAQNGHYIVVIGIYDAPGPKTRLKIADPANSKITDVDYDLVFYKLRGYWINTEYADPSYDAPNSKSSGSSSDEDSDSYYVEDSNDMENSSDSDY
jgi:hypothetical protein